MRYNGWLVASVLVGCTPEDTDSNDTSDTDVADTDVADTDVADTDLVDTDSPDTDVTETVAANQNYVLVSAVIAEEGFDFDDDGDVDNSLSWAENMANPIFSTALASASTVLVVQVWGAEDLADETVEMSLFTASDADSASDNASGSEAFTTALDLESDGQAPGSIDVSLDAYGAYGAEFLQDTIQIGEYTFEPTSPILIAGQVTADAHDIKIGFVVSADTLEPILTAAGLSEQQINGVLMLADVDMDDNGDDEGISIVIQGGLATCDVGE